MCIRVGVHPDTLWDCTRINTHTHTWLPMYIRVGVHPDTLWDLLEQGNEANLDQKQGEGLSASALGLGQGKSKRCRTHRTKSSIVLEAALQRCVGRIDYRCLGLEGRACDHQSNVVHKNVCMWGSGRKSLNKTYFPFCRDSVANFSGYISPNAEGYVQGLQGQTRERSKGQVCYSVARVCVFMCVRMHVRTMIYFLLYIKCL